VAKVTKYFKSLGHFSTETFLNLSLIESEVFLDEFLSHNDPVPDFKAMQDKSHKASIDETAIIQTAILTLTNGNAAQAGRNIISQFLNC
jgi:hypothetical protein